MKLVSQLFGMVLGALLYFPLLVIYDRFISPRIWKPPKVTLSTTPGCMSIKLGREESVTSKTLKGLLVALAENLIDHAESTLHIRDRVTLDRELGPMFRVEGELDTGDWSAAEGFKMLGQWLGTLSETIPYAHWEDLKLRLPNQPIDCSVLPTVRFAGFEPLPNLENLKTLTWSGHRRQLKDSWMPFTPDLLQSLTILNITCDITIDDCFYLLLHCKKITTFTLQTIVQRKINNADVSGIEPVFGRDLSGAQDQEIELSHLRSLTLASAQDIAPLFRPFKFTSLRAIDFNLSYDGSLKDIKESIPWAELKRVHLGGRVRRTDVTWVKSRCPGAHHTCFCIKRIKY
ncbi:hypothetical protein DXG03_009135 [Asterophora parasitica]|uniref:Uncharacterized protein n=1 Tax=Asterophora parasitica TaxID=117018 RepID=A0A9P7KDR5_9AGAR|nr:hypothetical protein DXG03_009135 [Asterophora parasitica]